MNESKKIPQWAVGFILTLVGVLFTVAGGLGTYVFTSLVGKVDQQGDILSRIDRRLMILEIKADTQEKLIRRENDK
jgi:hypothetical protein